MVWFFLLALMLGLVFGWRIAAVLLVLWLMGLVAFWLFMLFKPIKGDEVGKTIESAGRPFRSR